MQNLDINNNSPFIVLGPSGTTGSNDNTFLRSKNKSLFVFLASGGGGGSSGWSDVAGSSVTPGGGGGGCGGGFALIPSYFLPDIVNVVVGAGGAGGAGARIAANPGSNGTSTVIYVQNTSNTIVNCSGAGTGAGAPTTTTGGSGGGAGSIAATARAITFSVGFSGLAGGGNTTGTSVPVTQPFLSGGAGGAGTDTTNVANAGGGLTAVGIETVTSGAAGPTVAATTRNFLFNGLMPNSSRGGCGGGASLNAAGSNGARGSFGSGGGGGGASHSVADNGGSGGPGGAGFAILVEI
jgi:hypothetical protein